MNTPVETQSLGEDAGKGIEAEEKPDLFCATGILMYLSEKTEAFTDTGVAGPWTRKLARICVWATGAVISAGGICLLFGLRRNPIVQTTIPAAGIVVYGLWLVRLIALACRGWQTRKIWGRPTLVRIVERNEAHAADLTACSESLLLYAKDALKDHIAKVNGRMDTIFSKKGALPIFAGASLVWHNWLDIQVFLGRNLDHGSAALIAQYGVVLLVVLFGWFLLMRFGVWWSMSDYAFQMEIVETALRLKGLDEEMEKRKGPAIQGPADNS